MAESEWRASVHVARCVPARLAEVAHDGMCALNKMRHGACGERGLRSFEQLFF